MRHIEQELQDLSDIHRTATVRLMPDWVERNQSNYLERDAGVDCVDSDSYPADGEHPWTF